MVKTIGLLCALLASASGFLAKDEEPLAKATFEIAGFPRGHWSLYRWPENRYALVVSIINLEKAFEPEQFQAWILLKNGESLPQLKAPSGPTNFQKSGNITSTIEYTFPRDPKLPDLEAVIVRFTTNFSCIPLRPLLHR